MGRLGAIMAVAAAMCGLSSCGDDGERSAPGGGGGSAATGGSAGAAGSGNAGGAGGSTGGTGATGGSTGGSAGAPPSCGGGTKDPGEDCDDGNNVNGDGCSAICTTGTCGGAAGHVCEEGEICPGAIVPAADTAQCCSMACEVVADHVVYVDNTITSPTCDTYDVAARSCGGGVETAYDSLAGASAVAQAGWAVYVRGGTYQEPLVVEHSGAPGAHLTFARYQDEQPVITGASLQPGIDISSRQYVIIDGLVVDQVRRWLYALDAHHNVLRNCTFTRALDSGGSSKTGVFFQDATHNKIVNNLIEDSTQDNLALHHCDYNVIAGNTLRKAAHTLWAIKCGSFNVVRGNRFHNEDQKIGEIYDCDASGFDHEITLFDATKRNLVEGNVFEHAVKYYSTSGGNGIQYAGQQGILRRNAFYDTNGGLGLQRYSDEANYNTHNRVYHNVFYGNECGGVGLGSGTPGQFSDNLLMNNVLHANVGCEGVGDAQIIYRSLAGFSFLRNDIVGASPGAQVIQELFESGGTLATFESSHPEIFRDNLEVEPGFVAAESGDFALMPGSALIDQGWFLTATVSAGSGTTLVVEDASFFYDGFGIAAETGDIIQLEGQTARASIVAISLGSNTLTLDTPLTWDAGVGVALSYEGTAPDIGMVEAN